MKGQKKFEVTACFYKNAEGMSCRKHLNIKAENTDQIKPDLIILMLNPGSCGEQENIEWDREIEVKPDATLHRVLAFMKAHELSFVSVLNLSDRQEKSSDQFFKIIGTMGRNNLTVDSLFHQSRKEEFIVHAESGAPFLLACGLDPRSKILRETAISRIKECGFRIINEKEKPYHPLTRPINGSPKWLEQAGNQYQSFVKENGNNKTVKESLSKFQMTLEDRIRHAFELFVKFDFALPLITSAKQAGRWDLFAALLEESDLKSFKGTDNYDYVFVDRIANVKELYELLEQHNGKKVIIDAAANPKIISMKGGIEILEGAICSSPDSCMKWKVGQGYDVPGKRPFIFTGSVALLVAKSKKEILRKERFGYLVRDCMVL